MQERRVAITGRMRIYLINCSRKALQAVTTGMLLKSQEIRGKKVTLMTGKWSTSTGHSFLYLLFSR